MKGTHTHLCKVTHEQTLCVRMIRMFYKYPRYTSLHNAGSQSKTTR